MIFPDQSVVNASHRGKSVTHEGNLAEISLATQEDVRLLFWPKHELAAISYLSCNHQNSISHHFVKSRCHVHLQRKVPSSTNCRGAQFEQHAHLSPQFTFSPILLTLVIRVDLEPGGASLTFMVLQLVSKFMLQLVLWCFWEGCSYAVNQNMNSTSSRWSNNRMVYHNKWGTVVECVHCFENQLQYSTLVGHRFICLMCFLDVWGCQFKGVLWEIDMNSLEEGNFVGHFSSNAATKLVLSLSDFSTTCSSAFWKIEDSRARGKLLPNVRRLFCVASFKQWYAVSTFLSKRVDDPR